MSVLSIGLTYAIYLTLRCARCLQACLDACSGRPVTRTGNHTEWISNDLHWWPTDYACILFVSTHVLRFELADSSLIKHTPGLYSNKVKQKLCRGHGIPRPRWHLLNGFILHVASATGIHLPSDLALWQVWPWKLKLVRIIARGMIDDWLTFDQFGVWDFSFSTYGPTPCLSLRPWPLTLEVMTLVDDTGLAPSVGLY